MTVAIVVFDIDGVVRDVGNSYRRALADTVEQFTHGAYRPSQADIDALKNEGIWNNDWEASQELIYRYFEAQGRSRSADNNHGPGWVDYDELVRFFQSRYRGTDPLNWNGYICQEPLLLEPVYLEQLTLAAIKWGFFSGATRGSASYVLERRLGLSAPILVAMEEAPGKPNPAGLFATLQQIEASVQNIPVLYVGDTVADMYTVKNAHASQPDRTWIGVGVLPPHVLETGDRQTQYAQNLQQAGAQVVISNVQELTPVVIQQLVSN